jgi:hypothetical protein
MLPPLVTKGNSGTRIGMLAVLETNIFKAGTHRAMGGREVSIDGSTVADLFRRLRDWMPRTSPTATRSITSSRAGT